MSKLIFTGPDDQGYVTVSLKEDGTSVPLVMAYYDREMHTLVAEELKSGFSKKGDFEDLLLKEEIVRKLARIFDSPPRAIFETHSRSSSPRFRETHQAEVLATLAEDIKGEDTAIAQYTTHIHNPAISGKHRGTLIHIRDEELEHKKELTELVEKGIK